MKARTTIPSELPQNAFSVVWQGLRVSAPERLWCELAAILSLPDLVAVGDHLIRRASRLTTKVKLADGVESWTGHRGIRKLRAALSLLSDRSESRKESELRVIILQAGFVGLAANYEITTSGGFRYRGDLVFPEHKVIIEYQGDYHRGPEQFRADMTRISRLQADGWFVIQINADDLRDPHELIRRIRKVLLSHPAMR